MDNHGLCVARCVAPASQSALSGLGIEHERLCVARCMINNLSWPGMDRHGFIVSLVTVRSDVGSCVHVVCNGLAGVCMALAAVDMSMA